MDYSDTANDEIRDFLQMVARYITNISSCSSSSNVIFFNNNVSRNGH